jgi:predicted dehydrogenase
MRFAIIGDHPDGWAMARAIAASGRHEIGPYCGRRTETEIPGVSLSADLEEVLADPAIDAVIVAGGPGERLDQLRRVLQSERPALCVHPVDAKPDGAYEINMLQGDTHQVVLPILPFAASSTIAAVAEKLQSEPPPRLIEIEYRERDEVLFEGDGSAGGPRFPGWEILRRLGGAVAEVQAFAREEAVHRGEPVTMQGRFENGTLFRAAYLPAQAEAMLRITVIDSGGETVAESLAVKEADFQRLVESFEAAVTRQRTAPRALPGAGPATAHGDAISWHDEIRAAELDAAARRSIERRRAVTLEYQTVNEEIGFKGTMTLVGCGMLWAIPVLLLISVWFPYVGWLIIPILFGFLLLQLLRWFVPAPPDRV